MKLRHMILTLAAATLGLALCAPPVFAASDSAQGDASGPAAGKPTVPTAAAQKQAAGGGASSAAGGPGVAAKGGTESGPAPAGKEQPKNR